MTTSALGVRRAKAAFFSECKSHPAIAPAGSNRSGHGGDEMAEAFGIACHELVSLDFRFGSTIGFRKEGLLLLRSGYVRELASASYPHIQCGGGDFPGIAGGGCGGWRLT